jgi:hypothetical protein
VDTKELDSVLKLAKAIQDGTYTYETRSKKRKWFECEVYLDERSLAPYRGLLKRITGYDANLPDMDLTSSHPRRLCHTHITDTCAIVDGMYNAHVYVQAEEWNGQTACANRNAEDYTQADIGMRKFEREFVTTHNNHIVRNPNYGRKHHRAEPALGAPWLWARIFTWWRTEHATVEQKRVLDAVDALRGDSWYGKEYDIRESGGDAANLVGYSLYALDPSGTVNYDGKGKMARVYTWDEFKAL